MKHILHKTSYQIICIGGTTRLGYRWLPRGLDLGNAGKPLITASSSLAGGAVAAIVAIRPGSCAAMLLLPAMWTSFGTHVARHACFYALAAWVRRLTPPSCLPTALTRPRRTLDCLLHTRAFLWTVLLGQEDCTWA